MGKIQYKDKLTVFNKEYEGANEFKGPWPKYKHELTGFNKEYELSEDQNDILKELEKSRFWKIKKIEKIRKEEKKIL